MMKHRDFRLNGWDMDISHVRIIRHPDGTNSVYACMGESVFSRYLTEFPEGTIFVACEVEI